VPSGRPGARLQIIYTSRFVARVGRRTRYLYSRVESQLLYWRRATETSRRRLNPALALAGGSADPDDALAEIDLRTLEQTLRTKLAAWRGFLQRNHRAARQMVGKLILGKMRGPGD
jgi:hypothetical protein